MRPLHDTATKVRNMREPMNLTATRDFVGLRTFLCLSWFFGAVLFPDDCALAQTWAATGAPTYQYWASLASSSDGSKLVAAGSGNIYVSADSGATWTLTAAPVGNWCSVASSTDGMNLAASDELTNGVYVSNDSGATWRLTSAPSNSWNGYPIFIASSADGSRLAAAYSGFGGIYISTNSGNDWTLTTAPTNMNWGPIACSADGSKLIAVSQGGIYASANSGGTWTLNAVALPPKNGNDTCSAGYWTSIACSADGTKLVAGYGVGGNGCLNYSGGVNISTNSGATWTPAAIVTPYSQISAVACSPDGALIAAVSYFAGVYLSTNSGSAWIQNDYNVDPGTEWFSLAASAHGFTAASYHTIYVLSATVPFALDPPASQALAAGSSVTLSSPTDVSGAVPFTYQWQVNGTNIPGATNDLVTLTNLGLSDSGAYVLWVSNTYGSLLLTNTLLTVLPAIITTGVASGDVSAAPRSTDRSRPDRVTRRSGSSVAQTQIMGIRPRLSLPARI